MTASEPEVCTSRRPPRTRRAGCCRSTRSCPSSRCAARASLLVDARRPRAARPLRRPRRGAPRLRPPAPARRRSRRRPRRSSSRATWCRSKCAPAPRARSSASRPAGLTRVFLVNSGAEANENALRLALPRSTGRTPASSRVEGRLPRPHRGGRRGHLRRRASGTASREAPFEVDASCRAATSTALEAALERRRGGGADPRAGPGAWPAPCELGRRLPARGARADPRAPARC